MKTCLPLFLFFCLHSFLNYGQNPEVEIIQYPSFSGDSSYYDIAEINQGEYWIVGKNGVIHQLSENKLIKPLSYPNTGIHWLKIGKFTNGNVLIVGDYGNILIWDACQKHWNQKSLKGYKNKCFYNLVVIDSLTAYICGGNRNIALSKKRIPHGFVLKTNDGGVTWQRDFSRARFMFWSMKVSENNQKIVLMGYTPNATQFFEKDITINRWIKSYKLKGLFHDFCFSDAQCPVTVGSRTLNFRKNAMIAESPCHIWCNKEKGAFWDVEKIGRNFIVCGSKGYIVFKTPDNFWKQLPINIYENFYEIIPVSENQAIIVGSRQAVVKVIFLSY